MGSKSPVDELVDGIDAIGTILDENLPAIKARIKEINESQQDAARDVQDLRRNMEGTTEAYAELKKSMSLIDIRIEELSQIIGALSRRLDQIQKSVLDLTLGFSKETPDSELADTVKMLEDRLKSLETEGGVRRTDFRGRF